MAAAARKALSILGPEWMAHRNAALAALALTCAFAMPSFGSVLFGVSLTATVVILYVAPLSFGPPKAVGAVAIILGSSFLAIPGSLWWGDGHIFPTVGIALWMLPAAALYFADLTERVLLWLVPAFLIHAGVVIIEGLLSASRPVGLAHNPNLAGGFLVIGIAYLLTTRFKWLAGPLFIALIMTESRWAMVVCCLLVGFQLLRCVRLDLRALFSARWFEGRRRAQNGRAILLQAAGGVLLVTLAVTLFYHADRYRSLVNPGRLASDIDVRLASVVPQVAPVGVVETDGLHNTPVRIAVESGVAAGIAWLALGWWALRRRRWAGGWWMMLGILGLAMMDYYPFMGHMGGLWWLLVGLQMKLAGDSSPASVEPSGQT